MATSKSIVKRPLGKSGILVTPVGFGAMELSGGGKGLGRMFPVIPQEEKNAIVRAAVDGGINWIDTAEVYGNGVSEESVAAALKAAGKAPGEILIATKWFPLLRSAANLSRNVVSRLKHLGGFPIDLYMVHQPVSFSSPEAEMNAMADLVEAGKIRSVGVSNFSAQRMRRAHAALAKRGLPLAVNQVRFSLIHREIETNGVLAAARELGVTIIAYTPLGSGLLTGKYHRNPELIRAKRGLGRGQIRQRLEATRPLVEALEEIGARHEATPAQIALAWVTQARGEIVVTIPGGTKVSQAAESAASMKIGLEEGEIARLDELSRDFT